MSDQKINYTNDPDMPSWPMYPNSNVNPADVTKGELLDEIERLTAERDEARRIAEEFRDDLYGTHGRPHPLLWEEQS